MLRHLLPDVLLCSGREMLPDEQLLPGSGLCCSGCQPLLPGTGHLLCPGCQSLLPEALRSGLLCSGCHELLPGSVRPGVRCSGRLLPEGLCSWLCRSGRLLQQGLRLVLEARQPWLQHLRRSGDLLPGSLCSGLCRSGQLLHDDLQHLLCRSL